MCNRSDCPHKVKNLRLYKDLRKSTSFLHLDRKRRKTPGKTALLFILDFFPRPSWSFIWNCEKLILYTWFLLNSLWGISTWLFFWSGILVPWTFLTITPFGHGLFFVLNVSMVGISIIPILFKAFSEMIHNYKEYIDDQNTYYYYN